MATNTPRVYLAGKIEKDGWRTRIVPWHQLSFANDADMHRPEDWPQRWSEYRAGDYTVTGPFFMGCDHGCTHGTMTHASAGGCASLHRSLAREVIQRMCLRAIAASDAIFVWFDDPSAHGTMTEIGYAAALGKRIYLAAPDCPNGLPRWLPQGIEDGCSCIVHGDTWFPVHLAHLVIWADDPAEAFDRMVNDWRRVNPFFDSQVEADFWAAHREIGEPIADLCAQYSITARGNKYRLDFYSPELKRAIEVDGMAYHNGQESFISDRNRQRDLEMEGIRVLRFAAKEVMDDPIGCAKLAAEWAAAGRVEGV